MSYTTRRSESSASWRSQDGDTTEDGGDDRDESKRRSRNLSEKKRRDQFNILIKDLSSMVSTSSRKMDKSTVLKATIAFLKAHNELSVQSQAQETQEDWKPSFLSNEEFTHLMLEALDGFILVISNTGEVLYVSESVTSLLGHLPSDLVNSSVYDFLPPEEKSQLHITLSGGVDEKSKGSVSMVINFRLGGLEMNEENEKYQPVRFVGCYKRWISSSDCGSETTERSKGDYSESNDSSTSGFIMITTGRLIDSDLLREMSVVVDSAKSEFSSRHSLEWKFLFLDHRAPPIIGYLPFEVLGTSGYDYYHVEDLEKVAVCHEELMQKGEGTSCHYRFLTKGQQWIWLQTRFYITYHQWNSKPEFIVCTHRVVSYADVMKELRGGIGSESQKFAGPTVPKQSKESRRSHAFSFKSLNKMRSRGMSYGSISSKRSSFVRKLDLPTKFISTLSTSQSTSTSRQSSSAHLSGTVSDSVSSTCVPLCPQPFKNTVTVALHPHLPQFVPSSHQLAPAVQQGHSATGATLALPLATFQLNTLPTNSTFSITSSTSGNIFQSASSGNIVVPQGRSLLNSQCILQEQLMFKHAELQRQIMQQQEELRRVSEQLLMAQYGLIPSDGSIFIPQSNEIQSDTQRIQQQTSEEPSLVQLQQGYASVLQYQPSIVNYGDPTILQQHTTGHEGSI